MFNSKNTFICIINYPCLYLKLKTFMIEAYFDCPHCWENQLKMIDPSISNQTFIEDCETCCNPLEFNIQVQENIVQSFDVNSLEQ
jgi:transcription elongation factor Elf1